MRTGPPGSREECARARRACPACTSTRGVAFTTSASSRGRPAHHGIAGPRLGGAERRGNPHDVHRAPLARRGRRAAKEPDNERIATHDAPRDCHVRGVLEGHYPFRGEVDRRRRIVVEGSSELRFESLELCARTDDARSRAGASAVHQGRERADHDTRCLETEDLRRASIRPAAGGHGERSRCEDHAQARCPRELLQARRCHAQ